MINTMDIGKFGIFENMKWNREFGSGLYYFNKINIIYGENYSGKTTFSRIFGSLDNNEIHKDYIDDVDITISCDEREVKHSNIEEFNYDLMVYNSDFIERNLKWLIDDREIIQPFTVIGERSVDINQEIDSLKNKMDSEFRINREYNQKKEDLWRQYMSLKSIGDSRLTDIAKEIRTNQSTYGKYSYDRSHLSKDLLIVDENDKLNSSELDKLYQLLKDNSFSFKEEYEELMKTHNLDLKSIGEILGRVVTSANVIEEWKENEVLSKWIDQAYVIHKDTHETCQFCGGKIDSGIFDKIEKHFTKESEELNKEIDIKVEQLKALTVKYDYKIKSDEFVDTELDTIQTLNDLIDEYTQAVNFNIKELEKLLNKKKYTHFDSLELEIDIKQNYLDELVIKINDLYQEIVQNHNKYLSNYESEQIKIKEKIFKSKVIRTKESFISFDNESLNYDQYQTTIETYLQGHKLWDSVHESSNETIENLNESIEELENSLKEEQLAITGINEWMTFFFNSNNIELQLGDDEGRTFFKVLRNNDIAYNLSEGERRIISFCYYLTMLEDKIENMQIEEADSNLIIYIDDPISSLDHNHVFSVFSSIDNLIVKSKKYHQLFISTHSLEFLKYLNRLSEEKTLKNYYCISKSRREHDKVYCSRIMKMPHVMRDFSTEYQFLFDRIIYWENAFKQRDSQTLQGHINNAYTNFYDLPNIIRRFLEIHLFYNDPSDKSLERKLEEYIGNAKLSTMVNRIINEYSHTIAMERGMKPIVIGELEECIDVIMDSMEYNNKAQFDNLKNNTSKV